MTDESERKKELGDALKSVLIAQNEAASELREVRELRKRQNSQATYQTGLLLFIVAAWAFIAYLWIARPAFIFSAQPSAPLTADQREAHMRYAIYLQRGRVATYLAEKHRLPESLRETGSVEAGVEYERLTENSYDVFGTVDGTLLRLSDKMSADSFLGDAIRRLPPPPQ